jgi:hypothetical protein
VTPDLSLVSTDDLIREIAKRSDCGVAIYLQELTKKGNDLQVDRPSLHRWGSTFTQLGLLDYWKSHLLGEVFQSFTMDAPEKEEP